MRKYVPIVAVIPTRDRFDEALNLAHNIACDERVSNVLIYDNRPEPHALPNGWNTKVAIIDAHDLSIYEMWNEGWQAARMMFFNGPVDVAILNDDITILPGTLAALSDAMRSKGDLWCVSADYTEDTESGIAPYPAIQYVHGTYREGGIAGWCFMVRGEILRNPVPPIDTQFKWWCGDDDLVRQVELHGGKVAIVRGVPVDHEGTATGRRYPELHEIGWEDMRRFNAKYAAA